MKQDSTGYCKVCLVAHDEETHAATLAVRAWHRSQVVKGFEDTEEEPVQIPEVAETRVA